ncbi:MAG: NAD(P)H-dependent oxidoreductase subunit E [Chthoniobacterales bacterium]
MNSTPTQSPGQTKESAPRQADSLPTPLVEEMEEMITHYPVSKRSAALPLLHLWQNHFGFIDESGMEWIAEKLELQPINILELVTFYPWFRRQAPGKTHIRVCRTLSCALAGGYEVHKSFCKATKIDHEAALHNHGDGIPTSDDGNYSVEFVECLASCGSAPVCLIDNDLHERVDPENVDAALKAHAEKNTKQNP